MREPARIPLAEWEFALMPLSLLAVVVVVFGLIYWLDRRPTNGQK